MTTTPAPAVTGAPPAPLDDAALAGLAEDLLDAVLGCADLDTVGRDHWWDRARTALETAAATGRTTAGITARMARKLQVRVLDERTGHVVARLSAVLDADPDLMARWRTLAVDQAVTATLGVRMRRVARRTAKTPPAPAAAAPAAQTALEVTP